MAPGFIAVEKGGSAVIRWDCDACGAKLLGIVKPGLRTPMIEDGDGDGDGEVVGYVDELWWRVFIVACLGLV